MHNSKLEILGCDIMGSELNMHGPYYLHILAIHIKLYSLAYYYDAIDRYI